MKETHGHCPRGNPSPTYKTWRSMHIRCYDPRNASYKVYGAKGIRVCKRWFKFENFFADMRKYA